jgi:hypothetical protein
MIASFHLTRYPRGRAGQAASRMAFDRPALARTDGLMFWKLLGTGRGAAASLGADLRRWALFAVWADDGALDRFLDGSPVPARWRDAGQESWSVRLRYAGGHGRWGGRDPFGGALPAAAPLREPVAVLTRAAIRPRRLARFYRSVPAVDRSLASAEGCLRVVGAGEWPLARQATFSLWRDTTAIRDFAYRVGPHRSVISRTREEDWYSEECFARFIPYGSAGTWDGADPLGGG